MKTIVVYAKKPEAGRCLAACATHLGLPQRIKAVDSFPALMMAMRASHADVALVDVSVAAPDPVKFTRTLRTRYPRANVLLTGVANPATIEAIAAAGACGFVKARTGGADDLLLAFAQAIVIARSNLVNTGPVPRQRMAKPGPPELSERETQVLAGLTEGKHNSEIGRDLCLSKDTVKTHAKHLYRKLGARDRAHAVAIAFRKGLIS